MLYSPNPGRLMRAVAVSVVLLTSATVQTAAPAAATERVTNFSFETDYCPPESGVFVEIIQLSGTLIADFAITQDATGTYHGHGTMVFANFRGVGLTSGDSYLLANASAGAFQFDVDPYGYAIDFNGTRNFQQVLIRQGTGVAYIFHYTLRVRTASDGMQLVMENRFLDCTV